MNINEIKNLIHGAESKGRKLAMFNYQVLVNAKELEAVGGKAFCEQVNVKKGFVIEFQKMIALSKLLDDLGIELKPVSRKKK